MLHERIVESIRSGLITTDLDGKIYTFNAAATEITGYRPEEMQGKSIFTLFGDIKEPIDLSLEPRERRQLPRFETDLVTPDGFAVRIGYSISLLFSENNEPTGLDHHVPGPDRDPFDGGERAAKGPSCRGRTRGGRVWRTRSGIRSERCAGAIQVLESNTPPESMQADLMDIILRESDRLNSIITNFLSYARPEGRTNLSEIDVVRSDPRHVDAAAAQPGRY